MFLILLSLLHAYHLSVTEIRYDQEAHAIQITERLFLDDLELGLRKANSNEQFVIMEDSAMTHQYVQDYLMSHFKISIDGAEQDYQYLGSEIEDDVIWCYLEIKRIKRLQSIRLTNTLLTEVYEDQRNLVHFKIGDEKKSYILNAREIIANYPH